MFGWGRHACLGRALALKGMLGVFKSVVGLNNLRLDVGMKSVETGLGTAYLDAEWGVVGPFPTGLKEEMGRWEIGRLLLFFWLIWRCRVCYLLLILFKAEGSSMLRNKGREFMHGKESQI
ncbi:hypothetical protein EYC84_005288 [Monilinia fructicola]|uniref:Cytochrome P450 n=1 Tax=Monilinia fructicola TaxID=38448 RepID=A0A5M9JYJ4_MONFR|nr:hypothetical protein EYC84_005288 [Monilinia fructicola]